MLDFAILGLLGDGPRHGYELRRALGDLGFWQVSFGSLYPALHRLARRRWITSEWGVSENNRRAKFYRLTDSGKKQLSIETSKWEKLSEAIARVLKSVPDGT